MYDNIFNIYLGRTLNRSQEEAAEEWLNEIYPEFMPSYYAFKLKDANCFLTYLFNDSVKSTTSATNWWKIIEMKESKSSKLPVNFARFLLHLHTCPASSGSIERFFSSFGMIWSKIRNRLGIEKAEMLVRIYRHLRSRCTIADDCLMTLF